MYLDVVETRQKDVEKAYVRTVNGFGKNVSRIHSRRGLRAELAMMMDNLR
jgi:hypothetical protein